MLALTILLFGIPLLAGNDNVKLAHEAKAGEYTIRIFENEDAGINTLQFSRLDRIDFKRTRFSKFTVGLAYEDSLGCELVPPGKDINGDNVPDVVITEWTRGAHCCFLYHIFSLGTSVKEIAVIDAQHSDGSGFIDAHHNGILVFKTSDWTFAYWKASFIESPAPDIYLEWDGAAYRLDADLMIKPPKDAGELKDKASNVLANDQWSDELFDCMPPPILWAHMLDLIYSGNENQAWLFIDAAWNPTCPGKNKFLIEFKERLTHSPYWTDIQTLNEIDRLEKKSESIKPDNSIKQ